MINRYQIEVWYSGHYPPYDSPNYNMLGQEQEHLDSCWIILDVYSNKEMALNAVLIYQENPPPCGHIIRVVEITYKTIK